MSPLQILCLIYCSLIDFLIYDKVILIIRRLYPFLLYKKGPEQGHFYRAGKWLQKHQNSREPLTPNTIHRLQLGQHNQIHQRCQQSCRQHINNCSCNPGRHQSRVKQRVQDRAEILDITSTLILKELLHRIRDSFTILLIL